MRFLSLTLSVININLQHLRFSATSLTHTRTHTHHTHAQPPHTHRTHAPTHQTQTHHTHTQTHHTHHTHHTHTYTCPHAFVSVLLTESCRKRVTSLRSLSRRNWLFFNHNQQNKLSSLQRKLMPFWNIFSIATGILSWGKSAGAWSWPFIST